MEKHVKLFTPGPGDVDDTILEAMAQPVLRHYGPEWMEVYNETVSLLRQFFRTENDLYIVPGAASALMDMAIGSLVQPGKKIIVGTNGFFGDRLVDIGQAYGAVVVPFTAPWGKPLDPSLLEELLGRHPDASVVAAVHHETSTTVLNPVKGLADLARRAGKVIVVDAVSSLGGVALETDQWGIDICVSAANKCLEAMPGIGFMTVSRRAWELIEAGAGVGWYLNLRTWRRYAEAWASWHPYPITLPTNLILAARAGMLAILQRGLEEHFQRYARASQAMRAGLSRLGFEMFVPEGDAAPIVTAVRARPEFEIAELSKWLLAERNIAIGGGLGELAGKIFRVGHLGKAADEEYLACFFEAIQAFLGWKGIDSPG